ncbi:unnamed protein product [Amoebophrya sp. A25]|nr:unnamed protein product [Amoebophrya sp. A25]|eukprot:GSA25T00007792001.1
MYQRQGKELGPDSMRSLPGISQSAASIISDRSVVPVISNASSSSALAGIANDIATRAVQGGARGAGYASAQYSLMQGRNTPNNMLQNRLPSAGSTAQSAFLDLGGQLGGHLSANQARLFPAGDAEHVDVNDLIGRSYELQVDLRDVRQVDDANDDPVDVGGLVGETSKDTTELPLEDAGFLQQGATSLFSGRGLFAPTGGKGRYIQVNGSPTKPPSALSASATSSGEIMRPQAQGLDLQQALNALAFRTGADYYPDSDHTDVDPLTAAGDPLLLTPEDGDALKQRLITETMERARHIDVFGDRMNKSFLNLEDDRTMLREVAAVNARIQKNLQGKRRLKTKDPLPGKKKRESLIDAESSYIKPRHYAGTAEDDATESRDAAVNSLASTKMSGSMSSGKRVSTGFGSNTTRTGNTRKPTPAEVLKAREDKKKNGLGGSFVGKNKRTSAMVAGSLAGNPEQGFHYFNKAIEAEHRFKQFMLRLERYKEIRDQDLEKARLRRDKKLKLEIAEAEFYKAKLLAQACVPPEYHSMDIYDRWYKLHAPRRKEWLLHAQQEAARQQEEWHAKQMTPEHLISGEHKLNLQIRLDTEDAEERWEDFIKSQEVWMQQKRDGIKEAEEARRVKEDKEAMKFTFKPTTRANRGSLFEAAINGQYSCADPATRKTRFGAADTALVPKVDDQDLIADYAAEHAIALNFKIPPAVATISAQDPFFKKIGFAIKNYARAVPKLDEIDEDQ